MMLVGSKLTTQLESELFNPKVEENSVIFKHCALMKNGF